MLTEQRDGAPRAAVSLSLTVTAYRAVENARRYVQTLAAEVGDPWHSSQLADAASALDEAAHIVAVAGSVLRSMT